MAKLDSSLYCSVGLGIILAIVYAFPYLQFKNKSGKGISLLSSWFRKDESLEHTSSPQALEGEKATPTSKYLPGWWNDEEVYQLERRAIFSKTWLFVTHTSRFQKPGDYRTFDIADFSFLLILGKDRQLRAFHNVCRHRAYAVTKKECGSSIVLGCRYHGWSYDTRGKLLKAPEFENVKGFEKDLNGLWEVKTEIRESMVFINFDVGNEVTSQVLGGLEMDLRRWRTCEMEWVDEWKVEGNFNWKLAAGSLLRNSSRRKGLFSFLPFPSSEEYLSVFHTTVFRRLSSSEVLTLRLLPLSRNTTKVECNLYMKDFKDTKASRRRIDHLKMSIKLEIEQLEVEQHRLLHGDKDMPDYQQDELSDLLKQHKDAETKLGAEIHPAARKQSFTPEGLEDDDLCKEIETGSVSFCSANAKGLLDW